MVFSTEYYKEIIFDADKEIEEVFRATQGDSLSRGFFVDVEGRYATLDLSKLTMMFYAIKPDRKSIYAGSTYADGRFKIDLPDQTFTAAGRLSCVLNLKGENGESISSKSFSYVVDKGLIAGTLVSSHERGIIDTILDIGAKTIPEIQSLMVGMLESEDFRNTEEGKRGLAELERMELKRQLDLLKIEVEETNDLLIATNDLVGGEELDRVLAETNRSDAELLRGQLKEQLETLQTSLIALESEFTTTLEAGDTLITDLTAIKSDVNTLLIDVSREEALRVTAEGKRVDAEVLRGQTFTQKVTAFDTTTTQKVNGFIAETNRVEAMYPQRLTKVEGVSIEKGTVAPAQSEFWLDMTT